MMADGSDDLRAAGAEPPTVEEGGASIGIADGGRERAWGWSLVSRAWDWARSFAIAIVLFLFIRSYFIEAFKIPTGSMERTLLAGDFLLVNKLAYGAELPFTGHRIPGLDRPRAGDVVVFRWPMDGRTPYIKRLVGLPGDTIAMRGGVLYRNGLR